MNPDRWDSVSDWLNAWLDAAPGERESVLARLAAERPDIRAEVEALAAASAGAPGFLETPALVLGAREVAEQDLLLAPGTMVGPYRVLGLIARGGMGDVYRGADDRLHRDVALKVLRQSGPEDPRRIERFMHEARVTAALDHPNVVRIHDVGRVEDATYLVAELLEGETLRDRIARGPIPPAEVLRIVSEIARGLEAAHAAGLVHRDLKPDNVFLTRAGATKILDFGIAKLAEDDRVRSGFSTLTGVLLGTAGYIAPEQVRGEPVDGRADLFALGAVMYEMLTGQRAFARDHVVESLHAILHDPPADALAERGDIPPGLRAIVLRLLEKSPAARHQSAAEVIRALEDIDPDARGPSPPWRLPPLPGLLSRNRAGAVAAALAAVAAVFAVTAARHRSAGSPTETARPVSRLTLAVMPLRSIPPASGNEMLELGLADVLIGRLGQLPNLRVLPLTATERLRAEDPLEAARRLGADRVLAVTLQRQGRTVRAVPRLLSMAGETVWSTTVDTDAASVFSIQDIVVTRVVDELGPRLSAGARTALARPGTRDNAAWEAYVRGRGYVLRPTRDDLARAKASFEEAVRLDPGFADAWAGLGSAYKRMPIASGASTTDALPRARQAAERALALDPANAEAYSVLGTVAFWYDWNFAEAERLLRRALELQPSSADTQVFLAHVLANTGRHDEALEEIRRARALDPGWPVARAHEGHFLFIARRYQEALEHLDETLKVEPRFWPAHTFRALTLLALGRYEEAIVQSDRLAALRGAESQYSTVAARKGFALARLGRRGEAEAVLAEIRARPGARHGTGEALLLHALGRDEEAVAGLRAAVAERDLAVTFLGVYPMWDDLRDFPPFRALLAEVNLLEVSDRVRR